MLLLPKLAPLLLAGLTALALSSCEGGAAAPTVVIYCAHDEIFAAEVLADFEKTTGIKVRAKYDTEAAKTIGLVNTIIAEADAPRCDVFWNNELSQTINLARRGLLAPYDSPARKDLPESARDANWTAFAARARLIIVNTKILSDPAKRPRSLDDLIKAEFKGQVGIARPYFGTTSTHAAAIFQARGESAAIEWFEALQKNDVALCAGNANLKDRVVAGELACGLTDTDDFNLARLAGAPVEAIFPDQDGAGTLLIPNSVAMLRGAPHPEQAKKLIDYLCSAEVELRLRESRAAQIPLRTNLPPQDWIPAKLKAMSVDWSTIDQAFVRAQAALQKRFQ